MNKNFVTSLQFGKEAAVAAGAQIDTLAEGEIIVLNADTGAKVAAAADLTVAKVPRIQFAAMQNGVLVLSSILDGRYQKSTTKKDYSAEVPLFMGVGAASSLTGASAFPVHALEEEYSGRIVVDTELRFQPNRQLEIAFASYGIMGYTMMVELITQINALGANFNPTYKGDNEYLTGMISCDLAVAGKVAASALTTSSVTVAGAAPVVGKYITLYKDGSPEAGQDTFLIKSVSGQVATVDRTISAQTIATADFAIIDAAVPGFGIQLVAKKQVVDNPVDKFSTVSFTVALGDAFETNNKIGNSLAYCDVVEATAATCASPNGDGQQMRDLEVSVMGWKGFTDRMDIMRKQPSFGSVIGSTYNVIALSTEAPLVAHAMDVHSAPSAAILSYVGSTAGAGYVAMQALLANWATL